MRKSTFIKGRSANRSQAENQSLTRCLSNSTGAGVSDNLSASLELDDIIDNYDEVSCKSKSSSRISLANVRRALSHSHLAAKFSFSPLGNANDETYDYHGSSQDTTSFYSALQDGFSFSLDYHTASDPSGPAHGADISWSIDCLSERDTMLGRTNFEVFWQDISYQIKRPYSIRNFLSEFESHVNNWISPAFTACTSARSYDLEKSADRSNQQAPIKIIQDINGSFKSGQLMAILGPSGAGKTSLLNLLSRRKEEGYSGKLYAQNADRRLKISTIPQHDSLPEYLTVRENLLFASRVKNLERNFNHEASIERVATLLGIDVCLDTKTKKISGGQQKRLAIAQELLSKPDILILDEPTSGLDSRTCLQTLLVLKNLVSESQTKLSNPIAIVITIHQPQEEVFELFDRIYVMANGGRAIYDGDPSKCLAFVERHTGIRPSDADYNPASLLIDIASGEFGQEPIQTLVKQVNSSFRATISTSMTSRLDQISVKESQLSELNKNSFDSKLSLKIDRNIAKAYSVKQTHFFRKTKVLAGRCWLSILKDPKQLVGRILFHILMPVGLSLMMGQEPGSTIACPEFREKYHLSELVESDSLSGTRIQDQIMLSLENVSFMYILVYGLTAAGIGVVTLSFTLDIQRSIKEYFNGWYSMGSYLLARLITEIPVTVILPILTVAIGYPMSGQWTYSGMPDIYRFLITGLAVVLGLIVAQIIGMIFGAIYIGHVTTALFASQGATLPFVLLSGFVVRTKNMSNIVYYLSHISYLRHTLEAVVLARYGYNLCDCDPTKVRGQDVELTGVSDRLNSFMKYWMTSSMEENDSDQAQVNSTTDDDHLFQMIAKQISLYNTYGIKIKSCSDVVPYQLHELTLTEADLPRCFIALVLLSNIMVAFLYLTVKLVIKYRTSL